MKVALVQSDIVWENKVKNEEYAVEYILQAVKKGVQAVFFPEMSLTGFSMNIKLTAEEGMETVKKFSELAANYNIVIGIGWVRKNKKLAENHYTIIDRQGKELSDYVKIHPFSYAGEDMFFMSGDEIKYFRLEDYNWSNFICYDLRFPELFQIASKTAEVILVSANWPKEREEHWKCLLKARAIENQCYVLGVNCIGNNNGVEYSGYTCGISPNGEVLDVLIGKPGILIIDMQENVGELRKKFPIKQDRRWSLYLSRYIDMTYN